MELQQQSLELQQVLYGVSQLIAAFATQLGLLNSLFFILTCWLYPRVKIMGAVGLISL